ncbi:hypothetical protein PPERSA_11876 [Pseudocohnilembus persalinus]|uniref:Uncharacterized protein n=1 Tax=Pseudocohnilembus persalinus TaxID=266149 RepID=A0A0V0QK63_PSEPJ|nr:hypothetical protein PPERSA_11876 [Pseudocohnilembus persalinus]|eukprot:KRX02536.1 hypothetical protein PPERSA_11876 [Pseudocohnilembus persalinus]
MENQEEEIKAVDIIQYKLNFKKEIQNFNSELDTYDLIKKENEYDIDDIQSLYGKQALETYLNELPDDKSLQQIVNNKSDQDKQLYLKEFQNQKNLKFINKAQQNLTEIKPESLNIHYAITQINPPKFQQENIIQEQKMKSLESYKVKLQNDKPIIYEKNQLKNQINQDISQLNESNILFQVSVYRSIDGQKDKEFLMHDQQSLFELKQLIGCIAEDTNQNQNQNNGSFFFIEEVFYNDNSHIDNVDMSCEFLEKQKMFFNQQKAKQQQQMERDEDQFIYEDSDIEVIQNNNDGQQNLINGEIEYQQKDMQVIKLIDLKIIFGKPYVYRHFSQCDHMIVFSDMWFWISVVRRSAFDASSLFRHRKTFITEKNLMLSKEEEAIIKKYQEYRQTIDKEQTSLSEDDADIYSQG